MNHLTNFQLQEYADRLLDAAIAKEFEAHLRECEQCSRRMASFQRLEIELRKIPLEPVSEDFTIRVLEAIRFKNNFDFTRDVLKNLVPIGVVLIVIAVLLGIFAGPDSHQGPAGGNGSEIVESLNQKAEKATASGISTLLGWMNKALGFSATIPVLQYAAGLALFFVAIKLFDEFVFVPMTRKRS